MNNRISAASAARSPINLPLPIEVPRDAWAELIEHAAAAIAGRCIFDSETLVPELCAIAAAMRAEVQA